MVILRPLDGWDSGSTPECPIESLAKLEKCKKYPFCDHRFKSDNSHIGDWFSQVERWTFNPVIAGSNPVSPIYPKYDDKLFKVEEWQRGRLRWSWKPECPLDTIGSNPISFVICSEHDNERLSCLNQICKNVCQRWSNMVGSTPTSDVCFRVKKWVWQGIILNQTHTSMCVTQISIIWVQFLSKAFANVFYLIRNFAVNEVHGSSNLSVGVTKTIK